MNGVIKTTKRVSLKIIGTALKENKNEKFRAELMQLKKVHQLSILLFYAFLISLTYLVFAEAHKFRN